MKQELSPIPVKVLKTFKTTCLAFLFAFVYCNIQAQQVQQSDFIAVWTGTGSDGSFYSLTLNSDHSAVLKVNAVQTDVKWWKLVYNGGEIASFKGYNTIRLITNIPGNNGVVSQLNAAPNPNSAPIKKEYLASVNLDPSFTAMEMIVDFVNGTSFSNGGFSKSAVTINFTK